MKLPLSKRQILIILTVSIVLISAAAIISMTKHSKKEAEGEVLSTPSTEETYYTCSMHPQIRLPHPGKCPICSMPLIPAVTQRSTKAGTLSALNLSDQQMNQASVETVPVQKRKLIHEVRAVGKVQYNEGALATITIRVDGYVEKLFIDYTGAQVSKGDHLAEIYSPDLVIAQQELLIVSDNGKDSPLLKTVKLKLLRWGLTEEQISELIESKKLQERITIYSPITGTVLEKIAVEKSSVKAGDVLYRLANLDSVWVYLDIYESEIGWINYGQLVKFTAEAIPGKIFEGRVWFLSPTVNESTRTIKALVSVDNQNHSLKPGMYVHAAIETQQLQTGEPAPTGVEGKFSCPMHPLVLKDEPGACPICEMPLEQIQGKKRSISESELLVLSVPASAVLDSGHRRLVYVQKETGEFVPTEVTLGAKAGDFYPVIQGLKEGDLVVVRGNFLIDSQSQIAGKPSLFFKDGHQGVGGGAHQHGQTKQPSSVEPPAESSVTPAHKH